MASRFLNVGRRHRRDPLTIERTKLQLDRANFKGATNHAWQFDRARPDRHRHLLGDPMTTSRTKLALSQRARNDRLDVLGPRPSITCQAMSPSNHQEK